MTTATSFMKSPVVGRRRLGILDLSTGPSGLSRYVELLWPALQERFEISVFGDAQGPYVKLLSSFRSIRGDGTSSDAELEATPATKAGMMRRAWRACTPEFVRWTMGFRRETRRLASLLSKHNVDVFYVPICDAEATVAAARLAGVSRIVGTLHLPPPGRDRPVKRWFARATLKAVDKAIAVSEQIAHEWRQLSAGFRDKIVTIPNGVPVLDIAEDQARAFLNHPSICNDPMPTWLAAGRLADQKGFEYLVEAVALVRNEHSTFRVAIAGDGPLDATLRQQINRLGLTSNVVLLGQVKDMQPLYATCAGFVLSSVQEAMPFALLEAMATGTPAVATAVGGVPSLIRDSENGRLVAPKQPAQLAAAICQFLDNPHFAQQCGINGRATVAKQFSLEHMRQATVSVLAAGL